MCRVAPDRMAGRCAFLYENLTSGKWKASEKSRSGRPEDSSLPKPRSVIFIFCPRQYTPRPLPSVLYWARDQPRDIPRNAVHHFNLLDRRLFFFRYYPLPTPPYLKRLRVGLPIFLPVFSVFACLPVYVLTCASASPSVYLVICLPACLPACVPACLPAWPFMSHPHKQPARATQRNATKKQPFCVDGGHLRRPGQQDPLHLYPVHWSRPHLHAAAIREGNAGLPRCLSYQHKIRFSWVRLTYTSMYRR